MESVTIEGVLETYRCLLSCRKNMPGMPLEDAFSTEAVRDLEREYEWLKEHRDDLVGARSDGRAATEGKPQ